MANTKPAMQNKSIFSEIAIVKSISLLTAAMGIVNVLSAVTLSLTDRLKLLEQYSPFGVSHGGHLTSALAGFALLLPAVSISLLRANFRNSSAE